MSVATGRVYNAVPAPLDFSIDGHPFRLVPESLSKARAHDITPVPFLAPQYSTSATVSLADVNRSVEIPLAQNDFSGGLARSLEHTPATQTQVRYSKGVDTSGPPGTIYPGPKISTIGAVISNKPTRAVQKGNITYVACGVDLYQITDLSTRTLDTTFADAITDLRVFGDALFVGFGEAGAAMKYRVSDTIAAAFSAASPKADRIAVVQNNPIGPVFYATLTTTPSIQASSAPKTGPWLTFNIGDSGNGSGITSATAFADHLIVGKNDGPWVFTADYIAAPILDASIKLENYVTMVKETLVAQGVLWFSGKHSLYTWDGQHLESVGFDTLADPQVPGTSAPSFTVDGLAADPHWVYAVVAEQHASSPVGGVYIWKTGDRGKTWHNFLYRSSLGQGSGLLFVSNKLGSVSQNAVLFAYKVSTNWQLAYAPWPATLDPAKDAAYTFDNTTEETLRLLDFTAGVPTMSKRTSRLKVVADHLSTTAPVNAYANIDTDAAVKVATFEDSPDQEIAFLRGKDYRRFSPELRFTGGGTTAATVQQIHGIEFPARVLSRIVNRHRILLMAADNVALVTGGRVRPRGGHFTAGSWSAIIDDLRALRRENAEVDVRDEHGREFSAYLGDIAESQVEGPNESGSIDVLAITLDEVEQAA